MVLVIIVVEIIVKIVVIVIIVIIPYKVLASITALPSLGKTTIIEVQGV